MMRNLGHVLMWAGFLATALVSMEQSDQIYWPRYAVTAVVGVVGVVLLRKTAGAKEKTGEVVRTNLQTLENSLQVVFFMCAAIFLSDSFS